MRRGRRLTWIIFAMCALLVVDVLAWMTVQTLRLETREREARQQADLKELVRRVLWDMESLVIPILTTESARPYFHYRAFYPAERAYTRMFEELDPDDVLQPSPLLSEDVPFIRLHYEIDQSGTIRSPQAPSSNMQDLAEARGLRTGEQISVSRLRLIELEDMLVGERVASREEFEEQAGDIPMGIPVQGEVFKKIGESLAKEDFESRRNVIEQSASRNFQRANASQTPAGTQTGSGANGPGDAEDMDAMGILADKGGGSRAAGLINGQGAEPPAKLEQLALRNWDRADLDIPRETSAHDRVDATPGRELARASAPPSPVFIPIWRRDPAGGSLELFFERTIDLGGLARTQGFWVDWPALRAAMLDAVVKPRPDVASAIMGEFRADLVPMATGTVSGAALRLASLPVRLVPTILPSRTGMSLSPIRVTLIVTWLATLIAIGAIAIVLRAATVLSDRRGRFVSAVTHELRTPMTTFRMYSEMLAGGMVTDEAKRVRYLNTLRDESGRLSRIVESVLAYARLDRSRAHKVDGSAEAAGVLDRIRPALERIAERAESTIRIDFSAIGGDIHIPDDPEAIERICCNLVDNACKYGRDDDAGIEVAASVVGSFLHIRVRDHGAGIGWADRSRVFAAFDRSNHEGDSGNPGLGLGLALARGLARSLGGNLLLVRHDAPGAIFELRLPISP